MQSLSCSLFKKNPRMLIKDRSARFELSSLFYRRREPKGRGGCARASQGQRARAKSKVKAPPTLGRRSRSARAKSRSSHPPLCHEDQRTRTRHPPPPPPPPPQKKGQASDGRRKKNPGRRRKKWPKKKKKSHPKAPFFTAPRGFLGGGGGPTSEGYEVKVKKELGFEQRRARGIRAR